MKSFLFSFVVTVMILFWLSGCGSPSSLNANNGPQATPNPAATPSPNLTATYSSIYTNIIVPKCLSCHGSTAVTTGANIDYRDYAKTMASGTVIANQPMTSEIYIEVNRGTMPKNAPHLFTQEITAIYQWVANGALNN